MSNNQRSSFPFQPYEENLSAIKRKGDTSMMDEKTQMLINVYAWSSKGISTKEVNIKALAGVGKPLKLSLCDSSTLKFARRMAEKTAIINAIQ